MIRRPIVAFQKPITYHGSVMREEDDQDEDREAEAARRKRNDQQAKQHRDGQAHRRKTADAGGRARRSRRLSRQSGRASSMAVDFSDEWMPVFGQEHARTKMAGKALNAVAKRALRQVGRGGYSAGRVITSKPRWGRAIDNAGQSPVACGPGQAELREEAIARAKPAEVQVRALFGAISRGTERLVHAGRVPPSEYERMRAPLMAVSFRSR